MQMIDVLKRLAELDASNPNVAQPTLTQETSLATVSNIEGEQINECGPMGMSPMGMEKSTPASFSINASAGSGDEVANMMSQIMTLAGINQSSVHREPLSAEPHGIELDTDDGQSAGDEMGDLISMVDKMNGGDDVSVAQGDVDRDGDHDMDDHKAEKENEASGAGFDSATTVPDEKIKAHSYGDDQVTPKPKEPLKKAGGGNPYEQTVESVALQLLKDYQAFVNESK